MPFNVFQTNIFYICTYFLRLWAGGFRRLISDTVKEHNLFTLNISKCKSFNIYALLFIFKKLITITVTRNKVPWECERSIHFSKEH